MIRNRPEVVQPRFKYYADETRLKLFTNIGGFGRFFSILLKVLCPQTVFSVHSSLGGKVERLKSGGLWVLDLSLNPLL